MAWHTLDNVLMITPGQQVHSPDTVFDMAYWGEQYAAAPEDDLSRLPHLFPRRMLQISKMIGPIVGSVIRGQTTGANVAHGVTYNPLHPKLARLSPANYPESLLLLDLETMVPSYEQFETSGNPDHLHKTPRQLLLENMELKPSGAMEVDAAKVRYSDDTFVYSRKATILYNAPSKNGRSFPVEMGYYNYSADEENVSPERSFFFSTTPAATGITQGVRQTRVRYDSDGELARLSRIRSLEICAVGEPATVRAKAIRAFLGNLATNPA